MLHYFAADFFSPVLVSPNVDITNELRVYVISDLKPHTSLDLIMQVSVYNWQSFDPVYKRKYPFTMVSRKLQFCSIQIFCINRTIEKVVGILFEWDVRQAPQVLNQSFLLTVMSLYSDQRYVMPCVQLLRANLPIIKVRYNFNVSPNTKEQLNLYL